MIVTEPRVKQVFTCSLSSTRPTDAKDSDATANPEGDEMLAETYIICVCVYSHFCFTYFTEVHLTQIKPSTIFGIKYRTLVLNRGPLGDLVIKPL